MKKSFYYNFFPSKADEVAANFQCQPHEITRTLIEIRDYYSPPPPQLEGKHLWTIKKSITANEVLNGELLLSHNNVFDHIFRHWTIDLCNYIIEGNQFVVMIADYSDEENPKKFQGENIFYQGNDNTYILGCSDVIRSLFLQPGDEIGLLWDAKSGTFGFKLLSRGNSAKDS